MFTDSDSTQTSFRLRLHDSDSDSTALKESVMITFLSSLSYTAFVKEIIVYSSAGECRIVQTVQH
jgi:hypothetical protein